jgi:hypothetical protein
VYRAGRLLPALAAVALSAPPLRAQDPEPSPSPSPAPVATLARSPVELTTFVDAYYGYNFNRVDPDQLRNFDTKDDSMSVSLVEFAFEKKVTTSDRVGFRADLSFGPVTDTVHSFEPDGQSDVFKRFQQGYLSLLAGSKLQIDAGKFVTPHGAEVIESKDNWNYSRSLLFALAIPYYHLGLRASLPVSDRLTVSAFAVNGWNNSTDNNRGKTFGLQGVLKPGPKLTLAAAVMGGPEQEDNSRDKRFLFDTTLTFSPHPRLSLMANYDHGSDSVAGKDVTWQGVALYARLQATSTLALVPRFEYLDDGDAFMSGVSQKLKELTLTGEAKIAGGLLTRLEYRRDFSDTPFFNDSGGTLRKGRNTLMLGVVYAFGTSF